ncbi:MAG TPA: gamma-glutamyl-gamma-aminobutyrate hydrolase family protein [Gemmatimonadota bacterium]|nr:gamma-glutamyl-gamma-aminobutyrate hydrolase family protein [Gemmatimonadota bacterium]
MGGKQESQLSKDRLAGRSSIVCTVIRHVEIEDLGFLGEGLRRGGIAFRYVDASSLAPETLDLEGPLIVLGGPMGAYEVDRHPFLTFEIELIRRHMDAGRPVLGICLGAQLIAAAAGARVYPGERGKEIGWADVQLTDAGSADRIWTGFPRCFKTFHWHGDSFDIPDGAELLGSSDKYPQAFRLGPSAYAVQFHAEVVPARLEAWIRAYHLELQRERLSSQQVLAVPNPQEHRNLAARLGENVAAWLRDYIGPDDSTAQ